MPEKGRPPVHVHPTLFLHQTDRDRDRPREIDVREMALQCERTTNNERSERASEYEWVSELSRCSLPYFARVLGPRSPQRVPPQLADIVKLREI